MASPTGWEIETEERFADVARDLCPHPRPVVLGVVGGVDINGGIEIYEKLPVLQLVSYFAHELKNTSRSPMSEI